MSSTEKRPETTVGNHSVDNAAIEHSVQRLKTALQKNWSAGLSPAQHQVLISYIGTFASFLEFIDRDHNAGEIGATRSEYLKRPISRYLKSLNNWIERDVLPLTNDLELTNDKPDADQVKKFQASTLSESKRLEHASVPAPAKNKKEGKVANLGGAHPDFSKLTKSAEVIASDSKTIISEVKVLKSELASATRSIREDLFNSKKETAEALESYGRSISALTYDLKKIGDVLVALESLFREQESSLKYVYKKLSEIEEREKNKIHIRDSTQILEIRQDVERFITQDLLQVLSKTIMPVIATMRELELEQMRPALDSLEEKCKAAGLLTLEELYR